MIEQKNDHDSSSTCDQFRQAVFNAHIDELRGTANTSLANHIRECTQCNSIAKTILERYVSLDTVLERTVRVDTRQIVTQGRKRTRLWRLRASTWVPMKPNYGWITAGVATATIVLAFMLHPWSQQPLPTDHKQSTGHLIANESSSRTERQNFAVIQTSNPNIKIYWYF